MHQIQDFQPIDFVFAVWRRKWLIVIISVLAFAGASAAILKMPVTYRSSGLILVEQQEIPTQWVQSTVASFADDRIEAINQRVLTRTNLKRIIKKFNLFPNRRNRQTLDELVVLARANFSIESVVARSEASTIAFRIVYEDASAEAARDVVKELVSLYLEENLNARTQAAKDTRLFLETEADRIEIQLSDIEEQISEFKEINLGALPDQLSVNTQTLERVEQQIADINLSIGAIKERRIVLESSIDSARRIVNAQRLKLSDAALPSDQRLKDLNTEYLNLKARYSASHPDLVRLRREIALLDSQQSSGGSSAGAEELDFLKSELRAAKNRYTAEHPEVIRLEREVKLWVSNNKPRIKAKARSRVLPDDSVLVRLRNDLDTANSEELGLRSRKGDLYKKLESLSERIAKTPSVERDYRALIRDHENIQKKYTDIREKQNSARVAESLEAEQKGERFTLIEAPRVAEFPYSPDYRKLFILAFGLASVSGLGVAFALELIDGRIRNAQFVETLTGVPVLATIGYIRNKQDDRQKMRKRMLLFFSLVCMVGAIFFLIVSLDISFGTLHPRALLNLK